MEDKRTGPCENAYVCKNKHITVTVDIDYGVTPMFIACKKCPELAQSSMYPSGPRPKHIPDPQFEWFRKTDKQALDESEGILSEAYKHHKNGGLFLRERTAAKPLTHEERRIIHEQKQQNDT